MRAPAVKSVLALALLAGLTGCGAPSHPAEATDSVPPTPTARAETTAQVNLDIGPMADLVGGNVEGALIQLGPKADVTVTDSSGQDREVDDERDWKICTQEPMPGYPPNGDVIRLGAVLTGEDC
ncbi:hypothetical protein HHX38_04485 [Streptomyces sp. PKU-MA01144]|uniref:hypothetical protein n=1 Tax=Streptomyces sp. PKU-MA01144 TaxID=2729138 RepID=UPI00147CC5EE|nr:hypothetical protein [Streptomyces sp. PKU-MA01144]NNJ03395.1 hypothetical protein [Streptomyces sp. PKU-MA01144]